MHLSCPHCHNPIEVVTAIDGDEILCPSCGSTFRMESESTVSWKSLKGKSLGRFVLERSVGSGAFGTVYRAHDPQLDRVVAIKIPRAGNLGDQEELDRFLREGRSVAKLRHPGIVPVHEVGLADGLPYLVSEFIEGPNLSDVLTARSFSPREAAELTATVAEALHYAHGQGVVHRDVKPSNILFDGESHPHLMDFGLAKRDAGEITMTQDGQVLGTPAYMSPEQARGEAHRVDGRSDVYSLGVVLYRLMTGELPFRGNQRMLLHQVQHDDPRPPRKLNDHVPRDLETICLKCLEKPPEKRYATAQALADDLRRWLRDEPIQARPAGKIERAWRWCRRRPALAATGASAALLLLAVSAMSIVIAVRERTFSQEQQQFAQAQRKARIDAEEASRREATLRGVADTNLYLNSTALANREVLLGAFDRADRLLEQAPTSRRRWEWSFLKNQGRGELLALRGHKAKVASVAFSPDGTRIASAGQDGVVIASEASTGRELWRLPDFWTYHLRFSPDGRHLALACVDVVVLVDPASGREIRRLQGHRGVVGHVAFSRDGSRIASAGDDGTARVWDVTTGREIVCFRGHKDRVSHVAFSPDGERVASSWGYTFGTSSKLDDKKRSTDVRVWDAATGNVVSTLEPVNQAFVTGLLFAPDGRLLTAGFGWGGVAAWDTSTGKRLGANVATTRPVINMALSDDGTRLATAEGWFRTPTSGLINPLARSGEVRIWDSATGIELFAVRGHSGPITDLDFGSGGNRLATASFDTSVRLWDATAPRGSVLLHAHDAPIVWMKFGPDGTRLLTKDRRSWRLWRVDDGKELASGPVEERGGISRPGPPEAEGGTGIEVFSADGRFLLGTDGIVRDARSGRTLYPLDGYVYTSKRPPAFAADGRTVLAALPADGRPRRGTLGRGPFRLRTWDTASGQVLTDVPLTESDRGLQAPAFSPDGRLLAADVGTSDRFEDLLEQRPIRVWETSTGRVKVDCSPDHSEAYGLGFSPDSRRLIVGGVGGFFKVWDVETHRVLLDLDQQDDVFGISLSRDGKFLAAGVNDIHNEPIKVWDALTGHELCSVRLPPPAQIRLEQAFLGFSDDGSRLLTRRYRIASKPGDPASHAEISVWDVATGLELLTLRPRDESSNEFQVALSPGDRYLAVAEGKVVTVWPLARIVSENR